MITDDLLAAINEHPLIKPSLNQILLLTKHKVESDKLIAELHNQNEKMQEQMQCTYSGQCEYKAK
jgi:hypothetical protein